MSSNIQISGPFIRRFYRLNGGIDAGAPLGGIYSLGRQADNPCYSAAITTGEAVPAPHRRMSLILQNIGTTAPILVWLYPLDQTNSAPTMHLFAGQTVVLDNYNGPVFTDNQYGYLLASETFI